MTLEFLKKIEEEMEDIEKKTAKETIGDEEWERRVAFLRKTAAILSSAESGIMPQIHNAVTGEYGFPDTYQGTEKGGENKGRHSDCLSGFGWRTEYYETGFSDNFAIFFLMEEKSFALGKWDRKEKTEISPEQLVTKTSLLLSKAKEMTDAFVSFESYIEKFLALYVIVKDTGKRWINPDDNFGDDMTQFSAEEILEKRQAITTRIKERLE